jgi:HAD superfamily hydrolase (TIGR01490 family)
LAFLWCDRISQLNILKLKEHSLRLTLFDLDNTLLIGDSDYEWGQYLMELGAVDRSEYEQANERFYAEYKAGTLNIEAFLAFALKPLASYPEDQLQAWRADFIETCIKPRISNRARALVQQEQARSTLIAIVTATNRFVTAPIAALFGVSHLIATEPEKNHEGQYTGKVAGTPSFREGKIVRVDEWLSTLNHTWQDFDETAFYSDSLNDLPLLERVTEPYAVNPDPTLEQHALELGWPILNLQQASEEIGG